MITADSIPGFDPSAPLQFHTSNFGTTLAATIVVAVVVIALVAFVLGGRPPSSATPPWSHLLALPTIAAVILAVAAVAAVTVPVSPLAPARFDACEEASDWAEGRYGLTLSDANCEDLFKAKGGLLGGLGGSSQRTTLHNDGTELHAKRVGEQIILTDDMGQELPQSLAATS